MPSGSDGIPNLNNEPLALEPAVWTYVIVHELLHFRCAQPRQSVEKPDACDVGDWERCEAVLRAQSQEDSPSPSSRP